jgi:hypothetical protein
LRASVDTSGLELNRANLRFLRPEVEADYRAWHLEAAVPFTRTGMIASLFAWLLGVLGVSFGMPGSFVPFTISTLLGPVPVVLLVLAVSYRERPFPRLLHLTMVANMVSGLTVVGQFTWIVPLPTFGAAVVCVVGYFGFTIFRLLPGQALSAVLPYAFLAEVSLLISRRQLTEIDAVLYAGLVLLMLASGFLACVTIDRISRGSFRQQRIIELQYEAIDRERARADVAERSRELSEALLRLSDQPPTTLQSGDLIEERYRVLRVLGAGGMGQVHEVERIADGRRLALKVIRGNANREALLRFAREAQIASQLDHPNVVGVLDVGVARSGMFLVMELVGGASLEGHRQRFGEVAWALPILGQIAGALAAMHSRGIIHRDLKPSNVLLDGDVAKVADFGIASLELPAPSDDETVTMEKSLTVTGAVLGTPIYMAPELARGARHASPSADVFSLGVMAYELLSARRPFENAPVLSGQVSPPPGLSGVSSAIAALIDRCLAQSPESRPSAEELAAAIPRAAAG